MKTQKEKVFEIAEKLCIANNTVSTLEVKTELRKIYNQEPWFQHDVSNLMAELHVDDKLDYTYSGLFKVYSLVTAKTSTPAVTPKVVTPKPAPSTKTISRTKAIDIIQGSGGKFFSVKFTKKDGSLREMSCQYSKDSTPSPLGYVTVKDLVATRNNLTSEYRNINLQTLQEIKLSNVIYKVK